MQISLELFSINNLKGFAVDFEHFEWLKAREAMMETKSEEVDKNHLLERIPQEEKSIVRLLL